MSRQFLRVAAVSMPLVLWAPLAHAGESWTGFYVGVGGGIGMANHALNFSEGPDIGLPVAFDVGIDGLGGDGGLFTLGVGADYQVDRRFLIGAFFDYDWMNVDTDLINASVAAPGFDATANASFGIDNQWAIGARLGYLPTERTLLFVTIGYTQADISDARFSAAADGLGSISGVLASSGTASGYFIGGGAEIRLTDSLSLKGEYRYSNFGSEDVTLLPDLLPAANDFVSTSIDPTVQSARLSLTYRFNWDRPSAAPLK